MKPANLKIEKAQEAEKVFGGIGGDTYYLPARWRVTGPSGRTYLVTGSGAGFMQHSQWGYHYENNKGDDKKLHGSGFKSRGAALEAINKLEQGETRLPGGQS